MLISGIRKHECLFKSGFPPNKTYYEFRSEGIQAVWHESGASRIILDEFMSLNYY
jgi:hypothetical protein